MEPTLLDILIRAVQGGSLGFLSVQLVVSIRRRRQAEIARTRRAIEHGVIDFQPAVLELWSRPALPAPYELLCEVPLVQGGPDDTWSGHAVIVRTGTIGLARLRTTDGLTFPVPTGPGGIRFASLNCVMGDTLNCAGLTFALPA